VENAYVSVTPARRKRLAIRRNGDPHHILPVPFERLDKLAGFEVPQFRRFVPARSKRPFPVLAQHEVVHVPTVALDLEQFLPGLHVPDAEGAVAERVPAAGDELSAVWCKPDDPDRTLVPFELAEVVV